MRRAEIQLSQLPTEAGGWRQDKPVEDPEKIKRPHNFVRSARSGHGNCRIARRLDMYSKAASVASDAAWYARCPNGGGLSK